MERSKALELLRGWKIDLEREGVVLLGLRRLGGSINVYDDRLAWIGKEDGEYHEFEANTDPSRYYERVATLVGNRCYDYKIGKHGYGRDVPAYDAFRQAGPVLVDRYRLGHPFKREPLGDTINIHRGGKMTTSSAGCQTLPPDRWDAFREQGYHLLTKYGRQKKFKYLLLNDVLR